MYAFSENFGCIPLAVVILTTANGMQPTFSGWHTQLFVISYIYRLLTEIAEVNTDIARSVLKFTISLLPYGWFSQMTLHKNTFNLCFSISFIENRTQ